MPVLKTLSSPLSMTYSAGSVAVTAAPCSMTVWPAIAGVSWKALTTTFSCASSRTENMKHLPKDFLNLASCSSVFSKTGGFQYLSTSVRSALTPIRAPLVWALAMFFSNSASSMTSSSSSSSSSSDWSSASSPLRQVPEESAVSISSMPRSGPWSRTHSRGSGRAFSSATSFSSAVSSSALLSWASSSLASPTESSSSASSSSSVASFECSGAGVGRDWAASRSRSASVSSMSLTL
mmetsp:Transcript_58436/g.189248  ORF Transcript_58436/g.189248 Transcript_58436/m.189248 type:complete len:236 (-) Transcript_58436:1015-1722(-)